MFGIIILSDNSYYLDKEHVYIAPSGNLYIKNFE